MGGCFVACFGGNSNSNKKKPSRKPSQRFLIRDIIHGSYQPLEEDLEDSVIPEQPSSPIPLISSNKVTAKIKKKVRFDLNVQIYEPIPLQDEPDSSEDTTVSEGTSDWDPAGRPTLPLNNRYQNCRDTYYDDEEEEDEFVLADSDFEYESSDDDLDSFDDESLLMPLGQKNTNSSSTEDDAPFPRGRFVESVLNPVENLTQWKAIKAKESKCRSKENIPVEKNKITTPSCDLEELKSQCFHKKRDNMSLFSN